MKLPSPLSLLLLFFCFFVGGEAQAADDSDIARLESRRIALKRMGSPKYIGVGSSYQKTKSYDVLAATAQMGCGPQEWPEYMASLSTLPVATPGDGPVEMFALPPLVRYLYQFGDCMSHEQKRRLVDGITSQRQYLTGHGTLNHAIMRAASWYLLAQYFPGEKWTHWDGKTYTSTELKAELKRLMAGRAWRFYQSGQLELLSPTYAMINIFPLLNLIDFADDPEVRQRAEAEATLELAVLKAHSFHGVIVSPLTRKNFDQRNAEDVPRNYVTSISQQVLWYYFGEPAGFGLYDIQGRTESYYISMFGLSAWRPPGELWDMDPARNGGYAIKMNTPSFGIWDGVTTPEIYGDAYITDDFAIGTGNLLFDPDGYSEHIQTFSILLKSDKPQNQIECYHPYWNSNAGEDAWGTDRSSPFQQMYRYDDSSVVMLFDVPARDPWIYPGNSHFAKRDKHGDRLLQVAQCRVARDFDEIVTEPGWVFIRQGNVFVAMATLKGKNEYNKASAKLVDKYLVVKVREPRTAMFFRVEQARPDLDFAGFREMVRRQLPEYDPANSSVMLTEKSGARTQVKFDLRPSGKRWSAVPVVSRDGVPLVRDPAQVIDSRVLTLKNGKLTISAGARQQRIEVTK